MPIERNREKFSFLQKRLMHGFVHQWLAREMGNMKAGDLAARTRFPEDDKVLLAYFAASRISPALGDEAYQKPEEVSNALSVNLFHAIFHPKNPDFGPQGTREIVRKALGLAKLRWQVLEGDMGQAAFKRTYASATLGAIDRQLEIIDDAEKQDQSIRKSKAI